MADRKQEIIEECMRQSESCLYTSTSLFLWLRSIRLWNRVWVVVPIILGGIAGFSVLKETTPPWVAAALTLIAGFFPAIYDALKLKGHADEVAKYAAQFKVLQDRFRQAAKITASGDLGHLEAEFATLMDRMDAARAASLTAPQKFFDAAQKQVKSGNYTFTVDEPGAP
jgi:hypothetical protein